MSLNHKLFFFEVILKIYFQQFGLETLLKNANSIQVHSENGQLLWICKFENWICKTVSIGWVNWIVDGSWLMACGFKLKFNSHHTNGHCIQQSLFSTLYQPQSLPSRQHRTKKEYETGQMRGYKSGTISKVCGSVWRFHGGSEDWVHSGKSHHRKIENEHMRKKYYQRYRKRYLYMKSLIGLFWYRKTNMRNNVYWHWMDIKKQIQENTVT